MAEGQASRVVGRSNIGFHEKDTSPFEYFDLSLVILPITPANRVFPR
jgi:hypothetical protein